MTIERLTDLDFECQQLEREGKDMSSLRGDIWSRIEDAVADKLDGNAEHCARVRQQREAKRKVKNG